MISMTKTILMLVISVLAASCVFAQARPPRAQNLLVTVYEEYAIGKVRLIQTREDGSQAVQEVKWKMPSTFTRLAAHEDSLMLQLKPFFDAGWKLVSTSATGSHTDDTYTTRFFLRKEP
jgi:hypothetical protein